MKTVYILLPCCLFVLAACNHEKETPAPASPGPNTIALTHTQLRNISLDTANAVPEEESLSLTGKISFDESKVEKVYPLVGGNVMSVMVSLGDQVHKNQLLATIRSAEISDLQSQFTVAQNNMNVAKKDLDIAKELYRTHAYSEVQLVSAERDYSSAETEVKRLTQALAVYGASGTSSDGLYNIYSPIDGYVVEKNINEGMEIRTDFGANIFTVSALSTVWVLADVYESDLPKVQVGDPVEVTTLAYGDRIFSGVIGQVGNLLDPETKTMKVRVVLDNPEGLLKPEMFAVVKVHISHPAKAVKIPSAAVVFDNNKYYVMVRRSDTLFEKREVIPGPSFGSDVYIRSGLKEGEVLVTEGSLLAESNNF